MISLECIRISSSVPTVPIISSRYLAERLEITHEHIIRAIDVHTGKYDDQTKNKMFMPVLWLSNGVIYKAYEITMAGIMHLHYSRCDWAKILEEHARAMISYKKHHLDFMAKMCHCFLNWDKLSEDQQVNTLPWIEQYLQN